MDQAKKDGNVTITGDLSQVDLNFHYDEDRKADVLTVVVTGKDGKQKAIRVTTRVSPSDGAVLMYDYTSSSIS